MAEGGATIIIKKVKKGGHGHHGGAWKVAYADFVTAIYKGVTRENNSKINPWKAQIRVNDKLIHLGLFPTPEKAHKAYIKSARKHFGEYAHG